MEAQSYLWYVMFGGMCVVVSAVPVIFVVRAI